MTLAALALAALALLSPAADDRRFKIVVDHKTGYIDATGHEVIPPRYDGGRAFTEGLAAVRVESKWGYVDTAGRVVVAPQYAEAFEFSEGLAFVEDERDGGHNGFIDHTGKLVLDLGSAQNISSFSEGLAVMDSGNGYVYIDKTGRRAIDREYYTAFAFSCGRALVQFETRRGHMVWGIIDTHGRLVRRATAERLGGWFGATGKGGPCLAFFHTDRGWGCIDTAGRFVVRPQFEYSLETGPSFSEGLALVLTADFEPWYVDARGRKVLEPPGNQSGNFSEGLAWFVGANGKTGYFDRTGKIVLEPQFDEAWDFVDGLSEVRVGPTRGYVDRTGRFVWKTSPKDPTYHMRSDSRPARNGGVRYGVLFRHHIERLLADRSPDGEPIFVAVGRADPPRALVTALRAYRADLRPLSARAAFARHWSSINTAPAGDSEAVSTGVLLAVRRLAWRSPTEAEADVQVSYAAVGNADGATMVYRDLVAWNGSAWRVAAEEVLSAAG
jgi:hypothetical protein